MKKLSKKEAKYRIKFIQEHHYNKAEQKVFDEAVRTQLERYVCVYKFAKNGNVFSFMVVISIGRLTKVFETIGVSSRKMIENLMNFGGHRC